MIRPCAKYKENLRYDESWVYSYGTKVGCIWDSVCIIQLGWWSVTTQKHLNYASKYLSLELIKRREL